ncbi:helix-turn-helix domain-containing protein [Daejeonella sp.]|uniref:helix-turn-helix domain-containing protein n=1 Tax=Daejeonella sp. TaxID=2805397 RepID=UPI0030BD9542
MGATDNKRTDERKPRLFREQLVTVEDLIDFREALLNDLRKLIAATSGGVAKKWLKSAEVQEMLRISSGKLQYLRDSGVIPFTKLGGVTYYDSEEIDQLMKSTSSNPMKLV